MSLTPPQRERFAQEYIVDLNGKQAAIRAGYSPKTAEAQASRLLSNVKVRDRIQEMMNERSEKTGINAERVLKEIERLAFYDLGDAELKKVKSLADIAKLPESLRRAIVGYGYDKKGRFILKFADKTRSLEQYGKHLKLFTDVIDNRHTFTQMGRIVSNGEAMEFNVGQPLPKGNAP